MTVEYDFLSPTDKPSITGITHPEWLEFTKSVLQELDYKVHSPINHADFLSQFAQVQYQVTILEETFDCTDLNENLCLRNLQFMPMHQRRHGVAILLGPSFKTLDPMQAFQQSVHAVVHPDNLDALGQIILKIVADNDLFLNIFRDTQLRISQGKA